MLKNVFSPLFLLSLFTPSGRTEDRKKFPWSEEVSSSTKTQWNTCCSSRSLSIAVEPCFTWLLAAGYVTRGWHPTNWRPWWARDHQRFASDHLLLSANPSKSSLITPDGPDDGWTPARAARMTTGQRQESDHKGFGSHCHESLRVLVTGQKDKRERICLAGGSCTTKLLRTEVLWNVSKKGLKEFQYWHERSNLDLSIISEFWFVHYLRNLIFTSPQRFSHLSNIQNCWLWKQVN